MFCASKIIKHIDIKNKAILSLRFNALVKRRNNTDKRGGKNRYIPLKAVYIKNKATYTNGAIEFL